MLNGRASSNDRFWRRLCLPIAVCGILFCSTLLRVCSPRHPMAAKFHSWRQERKSVWRSSSPKLSTSLHFMRWVLIGDENFSYLIAVVIRMRSWSTASVHHALSELFTTISWGGTTFDIAFSGRTPVLAAPVETAMAGSFCSKAVMQRMIVKPSLSPDGLMMFTWTTQKQTYLTPHKSVSQRFKIGLQLLS